MFSFVFWFISQASAPLIRQKEKALFERVNTFFEFFFNSWPLTIQNSFDMPLEYVIGICHLNMSLEYIPRKRKTNIIARKLLP